MRNIINYAIEDFRGGIAGQRKRGPRGSFKFGYGLNIHDEDNVLKCNQKLKKDSGSVVVDLPLTMFKGSDGAMYAFGDTGKIYRKPQAGSWTLAYTDTDGKITGASEFENNNGSGVYTRYIYWATQTKLKRIAISAAGGAWSPTEVGTFKSAVVGHYHTMRVAAGVLIICDGQYMAQVDREAAFNNEAFTHPSGITSKALLDRHDRIISGTLDDLTDGWIFTWDRFADSWLTKSETQSGVVNAMRYLEGGIMVQSGDEGKLRFWNFSDVYPLKRIPETNWCYPGAIEEYNGNVVIGMNGGTKDGVYSIGRNDKNDPLALNLEYIPSHGKITGTQIGAIAKDTDEIYVSWKDGTTYGIDIIDENNKATGVYEGMEFDAKQPETTKFFQHIKIVSKPLANNCEVAVKFKTNRDTEWIATKRSDGEEKMTEGESIGIFDIEGYGESYEVRVELTPSGNNTPEILSINNYYQLADAI